MADRRIQDLTPASSVQDNDLFVLEQGGEAKSLQGGTFKTYAGQDAEAYAKGTRGGVPVPSTDPAYNNNAEYWARQAQGAIPPGYDASGVVRGDIAQTAQTEGWQKQAQENIGISDIVEPLINQWDEQWELGDINSETGADAPADTVWRTKGYITIKPNIDYYIAYEGDSGEHGIRTRFYDSNKNYIGYLDKNSFEPKTNKRFVAPENAYYLRFAPRISDVPSHVLSINYPSTYTGYYPSALPKTNAHIGMLGNVIGMRGWNQLLDYHKFDNASKNGITITNNNDGSISVVGTASATTTIDFAYNLTTIVGHKYFGAGGGTNFKLYRNNPYNEWNGERILTPVNQTYTNTYFGVAISAGITVNERIYPQYFDLTAMGLDSINSPEEFRALSPADYYPYASGGWADLLWENASPTSSFAGQEISLDLTSYSFVDIVFRETTVAERYANYVIKRNSAQNIVMVNYNGSGNYVRQAIAYTNRVEFLGGYNQTVNDDSAMIPIGIYGIH